MNIINKENTLKIAQTGKADDLELQVKGKSIMWPYLVMIVLAALFSFFKALHGFPIADLAATICTSIYASAFYRYLKTGEQQDPFLTVAMSVIALVAIIYLFVGQQPTGNKPELRNNVKQSRLKKNLSQVTLVKLVGVSRSAASSIETGQFSPAAKLALLLCIAFDRKFENLFRF